MGILFYIFLHKINFLLWGLKLFLNTLFTWHRSLNYSSFRKKSGITNINIKLKYQSLFYILKLLVVSFPYPLEVLLYWTACNFTFGIILYYIYSNLFELKLSLIKSFLFGGKLKSIRLSKNYDSFSLVSSLLASFNFGRIKLDRIDKFLIEGRKIWPLFTLDVSESLFYFNLGNYLFWCLLFICSIIYECVGKALPQSISHIKAWSILKEKIYVYIFIVLNIFNFKN